MRVSIHTVCAHRTFKNYYNPTAKTYTLTQDKLTDSAAMEAVSPFESLAGPLQMEYKAGEKWGVKCTGALSDRRAAYPELILKWGYSEAHRGALILLVEMQVTRGTQPAAENVTLKIEDGKGKEIAPRILQKAWRHLDPEETKVGVMVFAVVDPAQGDLTAGVSLRLLDATTFSGDRTQLWTATLLQQDVEMEAMHSRRVADLMRDMEALEECGSLLEIGYPASRLNSIESLPDFPDLATLHNITH